MALQKKIFVLIEFHSFFFFSSVSLSLSPELLLIKKPNVHGERGPAQEMSNVIQKDERNISEQRADYPNIYPQTTGGARISRNG